LRSVETAFAGLAPTLGVKHKDRSRDKRAIPASPAEAFLFIFIIEGSMKNEV
jgi:hypothetical protein